MKTYRERKLYKRVQLARTAPDGKPLRDEAGHVRLDADGQWFFVVSTGADRARLLPVDHIAFFAWKAGEATRVLQAKGKAGVVTPERLYAHYATRYTKPGETYAPAGRPEEFTLVLSKHLCVNATHGAYGASRTGADDVLADDLSALAGLLAEDVEPLPAAPPGATDPAPEEPTTRKRKGKVAPAPEPVEELGTVTMADLMG